MFCGYIGRLGRENGEFGLPVHLEALSANASVPYNDTNADQRLRFALLRGT